MLNKCRLDYSVVNENVSKTHKAGASAMKNKLQSRLYALTESKRTSACFLSKSCYQYPVYNFTELDISPSLVQFMTKFEPRSNIFAFRPDELKTMAEIDSVAAEIDDLYVEEGEISKMNKRCGGSCAKPHTPSTTLPNVNMRRKRARIYVQWLDNSVIFVLKIR